MNERVFCPVNGPSFTDAYCRGCGKPYERLVAQQRYCSQACSNRTRQQKFRERKFWEEKRVVGRA
jgi:hypothetical protein